MPRRPPAKLGFGYLARDYLIARDRVREAQGTCLASSSGYSFTRQSATAHSLAARAISMSDMALA